MMHERAHHRGVSWPILLALSFSLAARAADERPNILWITCEDISPNLGCYGDPYAVTPNLDRLAMQGVRYTHAFAPIGVCASSRSSLILGTHASSAGTHHLRCVSSRPEYLKCFTEYLRPAGYYATNNQKTDYNFPAPREAWDESSNRAHWRGRNLLLFRPWRGDAPEQALALRLEPARSPDHPLPREVEALGVLDAMGEKARPALEAIREARKRKQEYVDRLVDHALRSLGE